MAKSRVFSGIQPSGDLHIGNYLGAIRQWIGMQDETEAFFCVVDEHAITVQQDPATLRARTLEIAKLYLAAGIDPTRATLFVQSQVPEHTELGWILNTIAKNGDLTKMTQFKSKALVDFDEFSANTIKKLNFSRLNAQMKNVFVKDENILNNESVVKILELAIEEVGSSFDDNIKKPFNSVGVGLFDYPVLMAADILLYDTEVVPVGEDQVQHIELARTLARRFNRRFGEIFVVPKSEVKTEGARIMSLDDPTKKMSKSAPSDSSRIGLLDEPERARKKIMKAMTDSGSEIRSADDAPALRNLINIYSLFGDVSTAEVVARYRGKGYADFKHDLGEIVAGFLMDFQKKFHALSDEETLRILRDGAARARATASEKMRIIRDRVGFLA